MLSVKFELFTKLLPFGCAEDLLNLLSPYDNKLIRFSSSLTLFDNVSNLSSAKLLMETENKKSKG